MPGFVSVETEFGFLYLDADTEVTFPVIRDEAVEDEDGVETPVEDGIYAATRYTIDILHPREYVVAEQETYDVLAQAVYGDLLNVREDAEYRQVSDAEARELIQKAGADVGFFFPEDEAADDGE